MMSCVRCEVFPAQTTAFGRWRWLEIRRFITRTVAPHAALQPKGWRSKTEHGT